MALPCPEDLMAIAHIVKAHGVHGELSAVVLAPPILEAAMLIEGRRLYARDRQGGLREVRGLQVRPHQDRWLITLEGVETMDEARALRESDLCLPRAELPPLPEGWYWEADLQRCQVVDRTLGEIGAVRGLNLGFIQPQLELKRPDGSIALIPWVKAFIQEVNLEAGRVLTDLPPDFPGVSSSSTTV